jgi:hypothetical protein
MYGTIHHHTNEKQSTNKSVPAKWLESGQMHFCTMHEDEGRTDVIDVL